MSDPTLSEGDEVELKYKSVYGGWVRRSGTISRVYSGNVPTVFMFDPDERDTEWRLQGGELSVKQTGMWGRNTAHYRTIGKMVKVNA